MRKVADKKEPTQVELENKAASVLLGEGVDIEIKGLGKYTIKPLRLFAMAKIAKEATKIDKQDDTLTAMNVIASSVKYAKPASKIVAIAILRTKIKVWLFSGIFAKLLYWKLETEELNKLVMAVVAQSNASFFFSCTSLLGAMRMMEPKGTKETILSGEQ